MTTKEKMDLLLARVPEEQKSAFVAELREARSTEEYLDVVKKYGIQLTDQELEALSSAEVSDDDLDQASGGCDFDCISGFD